MWNRSRRCQQLYADLPRRAQQALIEHKEIYAACKAGDNTALLDPIDYTDLAGQFVDRVIKIHKTMEKGATA